MCKELSYEGKIQQIENWSWKGKEMDEEMNYIATYFFPLGEKSYIFYMAS